MKEASQKNDEFGGIDNGEQGLTAFFTDESLHVVCKGEGSHEMVLNLAEGCVTNNLLRTGTTRLKKPCFRFDNSFPTFEFGD
jgi:hypothetical protein